MYKTISPRMLSVFMLSMVFLGSLFSAGAQSKVVRGNVSASDGVSLPGVTVLIKGTSQGTTSDVDGNYSVGVDGVENPVLVFSYIGFVTQEIPVGDRTTIDVVMDTDVESLEEVMVIGYGTQQKKLTTGATGQVSGDQLVELSSTDALTAIQGQVAGVAISSTSGQPGSNQRVNIRGVGTIDNSGPLYVVDGIQTGDITYLNNADIASVDILKDAASAAIYGSQAANGVILITTKSGSKGKARWSFDSYYGVQEPVSQIRMLNNKEYATIMNEASVNSGGLPFFSADSIAQMGSGTDWIDQMVADNALTQNYSLGVTGGNGTSIYSASLAYTSQEGIIGGPDVSKFDRYSIRINSEHKYFDDILTFGQHLTFSYRKENGIAVGNQYNNSLRGAFATSPFLPVFDDSGDFLNNVGDAGVMHNGMAWTPWNPGESNPYASMLLNNQNDNRNQKMLGDFYLELQPIEGLRIRSRFGYDYYASQNRSFSPIYELSVFNFRNNDFAQQNMSQGLALTWDNTITYDMNFGDHNLTAMVGHFSWVNNGTSTYIRNADLTISDLEHAYIANTTNQDVTFLSYGGNPQDEVKLLSYFGRVLYDFQGKYLFNATFRADGSSRFSEDNRWGYFPSVSAGWVLSDEAFWGGLNNVSSYAKLRASWGQVGNQNVGTFQYLAPVQIGQADYYFGASEFDAAGNQVGGFIPRLPNTDIRWETSEQVNIGLDAHFFNSRLEANIDLYRKTTKDWLVQAPGYATDGANPPFINGGDVKNEGIELVLNWNDQIGDVNYFITLTGARNKNEVLSVPTEDGIIRGQANQLFNNAPEFYRRAETGFPIGYFWGYESLGVFQNEEAVAAHGAQPDAQPGDLIFKDLNNDGQIDDQDKTMIGDPNPDLTYGINFGLQWKGLDFSVLGYGVAGNQIVQSYRNHSDSRANYTKEILSRWHGEGTSNTTPRVTLGNVNYQNLSDAYVKDGAFFRINNVTMGYDFSTLVGSGFFGKLRLYASVLNAYTFTEYDGMDPEVGYGIENGSQGVDLGFYPRPRTYLLGLNINF